jgi:hypothetical protein
MVKSTEVALPKKVSWQQVRREGITREGSGQDGLATQGLQARQ